MLLLLMPIALSYGSGTKWEKVSVRSKYFTVESILLCYLDITPDFHIVFQSKEENDSFMKIPATLTSPHQLSSVLVSHPARLRILRGKQTAVHAGRSELSVTGPLPHSINRELEMCIATLNAQ